MSRRDTVNEKGELGSTGTASCEGGSGTAVVTRGMIGETAREEGGLGSSMGGGNTVSAHLSRSCTAVCEGGSNAAPCEGGSNAAAGDEGGTVVVTSGAGDSGSGAGDSGSGTVVVAGSSMGDSGSGTVVITSGTGDGGSSSGALVVAGSSMGDGDRASPHLSENPKELVSEAALVAPEPPASPDPHRLPFSTASNGIGQRCFNPCRAATFSSSAAGGSFQA
ncbi:unnamed protein product [Closterium sp. NIES-65]|nr:unnamed protein product [Closterium sp. NIES-65]